MTEYLTNDQISYIVHGYQKRTMSHSLFIIKVILSSNFNYIDNLILKLKFEHEWTYKKIGELLDITGERVRQILQRIFRVIRQMYNRYNKQLLM